MQNGLNPHLNQALLLAPPAQTGSLLASLVTHLLLNLALVRVQFLSTSNWSEMTGE